MKQFGNQQFTHSPYIKTLKLDINNKTFWSKKIQNIHIFFAIIFKFCGLKKAAKMFK